MRAGRQEWITGKKVRFLLQLRTERHPDLPDTATGLELAKDDESRAVLRLLIERQRERLSGSGKSVVWHKSLEEVSTASRTNTGSHAALFPVSRGQNGPLQSTNKPATGNGIGTRDESGGS